MKLTLLFKKHAFLSFIFIGFLLLTATNTQARSWYVDNNSSVGNIYNLTSAPFVAGNDTTGDGSATKPYATFSKAYAMAAVTGDIIYVDAGTYDVGVAAPGLSITKEIQIIGAGIIDTIFTTLSGSDEMFATITASNVVIKKIQLTNFNAVADGIALRITSGTGIVLDQVNLYGQIGEGGDGAVLISGSGTSVTIQNCLQPCNRIGGSLLGGALTINGSTVFITNSSFSNNQKSSADGGAIKISGPTAKVTINNCLFENNTARAGGAIEHLGGELSINNTCFSNNYSDNLNDGYGGGAIRVTNSTGNTTINNCSFTSNQARPIASGNSQDGGAILIISGNVSLNTCSFTSNNTGDDGEDVFIDTGKLFINQTTFNTIHTGSNEVNIYNVSGAVYMYKSGIPTVNGSGVAITKPETVIVNGYGVINDNIRTDVTGITATGWTDNQITNTTQLDLLNTVAAVFPTRTGTTFTSWTDTSVTGTTDVKLLSATSNAISPSFNVTSANYSKLVLTYSGGKNVAGATSAQGTLTIAYRVGAGAWTALTTNVFPNNTLSLWSFDASALLDLGTVQLRFSSLGANGTNGIILDDIALTGITATSTMISPLVPIAENNANLNFDLKRIGAGTFGSATDGRITVTVDYSTDLSTWTTLGTYAVNSTTFANQVVSLTSLTGQSLYFRFRSLLSTGTVGLSLDNIYFSQTNTAAPSTLPATVCINRYDGSCSGATIDTFVCATKNTWGDVSSATSNSDATFLYKGTNLPKTITAATNATSIVFTFAAAHGLVVGDWVIIEGCVPTTYNGIYKITAVTTTTPFKITVTRATAPGNITTKGTVTKGTPLGWSRKTIPTVDEHVIIDYDYNTTTYGNIDACKMTVNSGKTLTIDKDDYGTAGVDAKGTYVYVVNSILNNGTINVSTNGNLIQVNHPLDLNGETIVTPNINITKTTAKEYRWDYVYWSKPISNSDSMLTHLNDAFDRKYYWDASEATSYEKSYQGWLNLTGEPTIGTGFIARVRDISPYNVDPNGTTITIPTSNTNPISGTSNNGDYTTPSYIPYDTNDEAYKNYALVGNPYPGAIDFTAFYNDNKDKIYGTAYLWTSHTYYPGTGLYREADYASFNLSGGVGISGYDTTPNGYIASCQGFMVKPKGVYLASLTLTFKNSHRVRSIIGSVNTNEQFFRITAPEEKDRFWLNIMDGVKYNKEQLIGYFPEATDGRDDAYDGPLGDIGSIKFYSFIDTKKYSIQGKGTFDNNDRVAIGYTKTTTASEKLTISLTKKEGVFVNRQPIYLYDKELDKYTDLNKRPYEFTATTNTENRFEIVYKLPYNEEINTESNPVVVSIDNQLMTITADTDIEKVILYDVTGKLIFEKIMDRKSNVVNATVYISTGVYIAKVTLSNTKTQTLKLLKK